jgi:hypothetical protein
MTTMKRKFMLSAALLGLFSTGCDDEVIYIDPVHARADAQEVIAISLSYGSYGLVANVNQASNEIKEIADCGEVYQNSDSFHDENPVGYWSYDYQYEEEYLRLCDGDQAVDYNLTADEKFEAARTSYDHTISVDFKISGLADESNDEIYNGVYTRTGNWDAIYYDNNYSFTFESRVADTHVSKESHKIESGTVTFTLVQNYGNSNLDYVYEGTVEFLNEDEAKVVLTTEAHLPLIYIMLP